MAVYVFGGKVVKRGGGFLSTGGGGGGGTCNVTAASASQADVQTAINAASDGQTVCIPNGSATWTSGITTTKQIWIRAQNFTPTSGGSTSRNVTITNNAGTDDLFNITSGNTFAVQISGIKFLAGTGTGSFIIAQGTGTKPPMINDCYFDQPNNFSVLRNLSWNTCTGGVFWNNYWESTDDGGSGGVGSGSGCFHIISGKPWLDAQTWGANDTNGNLNLYIEDSTFVNIYNQAVDADDNGRIVIRHNTILNTQMLTHGTTSLQGGRQVELYNNAYQYRQTAPNSMGITWVNLNRYFWWRAGTSRVTDNTVEVIDSGGFWGNVKPSFLHIDESLTRAGSGAACQTVYPGTHWPGNGANGAAQISDPCYLWNNTGGGAVAGTGDTDPTNTLWNVNDQADTCGNGLMTINFFLLGRDIFIADPGNYTKYTYPHPLRR